MKCHICCIILYNELFSSWCSLHRFNKRYFVFVCRLFQLDFGWIDFYFSIVFFCYLFFTKRKRILIAGVIDNFVAK